MAFHAFLRARADRAVRTHSSSAQISAQAGQHSSNWGTSAVLGRVGSVHPLARLRPSAPERPTTFELAMLSAQRGSQKVFHRGMVSDNLYGIVRGVGRPAAQPIEVKRT